MTLDKLPINAFDLVLVITLATGIARGRKHGMSEELMLLLKWLIILFGCAMIYEPGGKFVGGWGLFGPLVLGLFALAKHRLGSQLLGSDIFGQAEYYLGMSSGCVRALCMLLAALALLNARAYNPAEIKAMEKFQDDVYGSNYFPTLHSVQASVFEKSLTGPFIKKYLSFVLIRPTAPQENTFHQREFAVP
jgi:hypothetical protein